MLPSVRCGALSLGALAVVSMLLPAPASIAQTVRDSTSTSSLPSLGDGQGMSVGAERRLGDRIARDIYRDPDYLDDPVLGDYLQALWQPLLGAARDRGDVAPELAERMAWELVVSRDKRVNAFALPGGYLGVNLGLIALTDKPEELASVMAHELSHVSQRHIARMMTREERMAPWMMAAMILGALAAGANGQVAGAAIAGSTAVAAQSQLNFSRDLEREADRVGFGVLTGAGFDGLGFVSMFDKMQQSSRYDDGSFPYLRSHPLTGERIADMRSRVPSGPVASQDGKAGAESVVRLPAAGSVAYGGAAGLRLDLPSTRGGAQGAAIGLPMPSRAQHALMSARARVLAENGPDRQRAWLTNGQSANASLGDRYAAALSALRLGQRDLALDLAQRLRSAVPPDARPTVDALSIEILLAPTSGGVASMPPTQAALLAELRDQALAGTSRTSALLGAQAALATGQPQRAVTRLQAWVSLQPRDAVAWQTLSRAYAVQGQQLRALRAEAESRAAHLDYAGAVDRFRVAQALPVAQRSSDSMELAIVDSRRREVEALLRETVREEEERR
ncbi:M48 family metalloprotease [Hydrogenophaga sp.]|uniref:M48 family metalloprotease n=1 Tax=Hydrogenophaga sp. TaxID=1904254 RepID=UPI002718DFBB|nr:M48 family metalloprotease [Hydrogenophaga sp.]MDO9438948.1 M48 family metalloprotease [Hydrogenophaga sp.]